MRLPINPNRGEYIVENDDILILKEVYKMHVNLDEEIYLEQVVTLPITHMMKITSIYEEESYIYE